MPPLKVYTVLCWHHLHNVWFKGVDDELTRYLKDEFKDELKVISEATNDDDGLSGNRLGDDYIDASVSGMLRLAEKLFD